MYIRELLAYFGCNTTSPKPPWATCLTSGTPLMLPLVPLAGLYICSLPAISVTNRRPSGRKVIAQGALNWVISSTLKPFTAVLEDEGGVEGNEFGGVVDGMADSVVSFALSLHA